MRLFGPVPVSSHAPSRDPAARPLRVPAHLILACTLLAGCAGPRLATLRDPGGCTLERVAVDPAVQQFQFDGLSPDGRTLAVGWQREQARGAYLLDLRSGKRKALPGAINNAASFSPDGRRLVSASSVPDRRTDLLELELASGAIRTLASDPAAEFLPSYSRDMTRLYFNSYRGGDSNLFVLELAGGEPRKLTMHAGYDAYARLSPDESQIAFHRELDKGNYEIVLLDLATGAERVLAPAPGEDAYPAWAPDGRSLVFSSDRASSAGHTDLWRIDLDGRNLRRITAGGGGDVYTTWSRDGRSLYFGSKRGDQGIYRLHLRADGHCR